MSKRSEFIRDSLLYGLLFFAISMLFSGCGSNPTEPTPPPQTVAPTPPPAPQFTLYPVCFHPRGQMVSLRRPIEGGNFEAVIRVTTTRTFTDRNGFVRQEQVTSFATETYTGTANLTAGEMCALISRMR